MLKSAVAAANIERTLVSRAQYHPFPKYDEREKWQALKPEAREFYINAADEVKGAAWPELKATMYMDFARNGDRSRFEAACFKRRDMLYALMLGECIKGSGEYIDDIINGIWTICEETSWVVPAHNNMENATGEFNALCDIDQPTYVDLFSAETASLLGWVYYFMGERLGRESRLIPRRIELELEKRIFRPYLSKNNWPWTGLSGNKHVNNWNPWINSNVLAAMLCVCAEDGERRDVFNKLTDSAQVFLDGYAPDGGCDEGPAYFNAAGASMFDVLDEMYGATGGAVDIFGEELIKNMGKYIMYVHIAREYHVNFADAAARVRPNCMLLLRYGRRTDQPELIYYARGAQAAGYGEESYRIHRWFIYRNISDMFMYDEALFAGAKCIEISQHFFPGIQVMTARSKANSTQGLFLAAKGGKNNESHNHNDIGNYVIYLNGEPAICDIGVETYCRKTFSTERYSIWTMQSGYHNTAIIGGCDQLPGADFCARNVHYCDGDAPALELDISQAYGADAGVENYVRRLELDRAAESITVRDNVTLKSPQTSLAIPVICAQKPVLGLGEAIIAVGESALRLSYPADIFDVSCEELPITDGRLMENWRRPALYRLLLTRKAASAHSEFEIKYDIVH